MQNTAPEPGAKRTRRQFIKTGQLAEAIAKIYGKKPVMVKDYMKEATRILPLLREMGLAYPRRFTNPTQKASITRGVAARIGDHNKALGYSKGIRKLPHKAGTKATAKAKPAASAKKRTISKAHLQAMIDGGKRARAKKKAGKKAGTAPPPRGQVAFIKDKKVTERKLTESTELISDLLLKTNDELENILDEYAFEMYNEIEQKNIDLVDKLKKAESLVAKQQAEIKSLKARLADVKSVLSL